MPNKQQRMQNKANYESLLLKVNSPRGCCPNCLQLLFARDSGHFVPPSLGEEGFFICKKAEVPGGAVQKVRLQEDSQGLATEKTSWF